jgi:hypothetical protein
MDNGPEFQQFPHCVKGTPGAEFVSEALAEKVVRVENSPAAKLPDDLTTYQQMEKQTLDIFQTQHADELVERLGSGQEFVVFGVADVGVKLQGLFEGHPDGSREVLYHGACPQRENVDSAVRLPVVEEWSRNPSCCMFGVPRPNPRPHAFFQVADDLVGNPGVDVLLFGSLHCLSPLRAFKKLHSLVMERCCAERPEQSQGSRFVAGDSFTLDGGKVCLCYGFRTRE